MNFISMGGPQAGVASLPPCFPVCATIHPSSVFLFVIFLILYYFKKYKILNIYILN